jgi:hypothetical protein
MIRSIVYCAPHALRLHVGLKRSLVGQAGVPQQVDESLMAEVRTVALAAARSLA